MASRLVMRITHRKVVTVLFCDVVAHVHVGAPGETILSVRGAEASVGCSV
jgi:hypothetical protein